MGSRTRAGGGRALKLDAGTEERLLSGSMAPADAPPGYAQVAGMLAAARPRAATGAIPGEILALSAYRAAIAGKPLLLPEERRAHHKPPRTRLVTRVPAKVALAGALVLVGGTAAAAATGSLPGPVQSTVSSMLSHVGISVPSSTPAVNTHPSPNASPHASLGAENSLYGLCTAATSRGSSAQAQIPARLSAAAATAGESVTQFCNSVPNPSSVNPASSPSAHKSDEAGTVQQQSTGSGGTAGPGGAVTHNGTPGPPADQGQGQGGGLGQGQGGGQGQGQGQGQSTSAGTGSTSNNGQHTGQQSTTTTTPVAPPTTVPPTTTTTSKSNNGNGHSSGTVSHNNGNGKG